VANVWSIGIFTEDNSFDLVGNRPANLSKLFNARKIRKGRRHVHTYADPFLFSFNSHLYLFAEIQEVGSKGYINCWRSKELENWEDLGEVLKESFHISYPFVFQAISGETFMIPEMGEHDITALYSFSDFPKDLRKERTVIKGPYADSNIFYKEGIYYLLTTNTENKQLKLFYSDNLLEGSWQHHPASPLSIDPVINRNGGGFVQENGRLFRIAQNTAKHYGGGIVILEVLELNKHVYRETIIIDDYGPLFNYSWQRKGRHHLSLVKFNGKTVIAMDGLQEDTFWNKILNLIFKFLLK
jgi:hypothetical protein